MYRSFSLYSKRFACAGGSLGKQLSCRTFLMSLSQSSYSYYSPSPKGRVCGLGCSQQIRKLCPLLTSTLPNLTRCLFVHLGRQPRFLDMHLRSPLSLKRASRTKIPIPSSIGGNLAGACACLSGSELVYAEAGKGNDDQLDKSSECLSHGKKVYKDYCVTGVPGDGRCLFRSVVHGACIRSGKPIPNEEHQRQLADELRGNVADEFIKRREETEWFIEGDFNTYVSDMRRPHVWGGEPELLMASHVLKMPITVFMHDRDLGGLIAIAEYGQEYGKENPVRVLYHGYGHYEALQIPGTKVTESRL